LRRGRGKRREERRGEGDIEKAKEKEKKDPPKGMTPSWAWQRRHWDRANPSASIDSSDPKEEKPTKSAVSGP